MRHIARMIIVAAVLGGLAIPSRPAVAQAPPHYTLIDLGTFGGPNSYFAGDAQILANRGIVGGSADTSTPDPYAPNCLNPDCLVAHAFRWQKGVLTDLGALPGVNSSFVNYVSQSGVPVGYSQTGTPDPLLGGAPEQRAVLWKDGKTINLGTLGGNESAAFTVNDRGQVSGFSSNTIPDPYSIFGLGTQTRALLWQDGTMHDLGTLGGPDAIGQVVNDAGQVAGESYINSTPNPVTGMPTAHPFLWQNGKMQDLGTLGGSLQSATGITGLNNRGEVVGPSDLAGDQTHHPFLWDGKRLLDLGTLGGDNGTAYWINDAGQVIGAADLTGSKSHHGFLWSDGKMTDLVPVGAVPCSNAFWINAGGQVAGNDTDCKGNAVSALLWDHGVAYDLNTLIAPSPLQLKEATDINDRGEIVATATLPNGNQHVALLVPTHRSTADDASVTSAGNSGSVASFTVSFDSSAPGQGQILFGSGPGCSGLVETATQDQGAGTTSHMVQVQGNDLPGTVGNNGIIPGTTYWYEAVTRISSGREVDDNGGKCYSVTIPTS